MYEPRSQRFRVTQSVPINASTLVRARSEEEAEQLARARWRERLKGWGRSLLPEEKEASVWKVDSSAFALLGADDETLRADDRLFTERLRGAITDLRGSETPLFKVTLTHIAEVEREVEAADEDAARDQTEGWWETIADAGFPEDPGPWGFEFELDLLGSWTEAEPVE